jgi:RNA polymerase sigma-70 factor (ECF subfamily)
MTSGTAAAAARRDHLSVLIARAAAGDDAAFSELYALTHRKMRKTINAVCPGGAEIEDILQDAYFKIWRNASNFNPARSSPISWMTVIVRNTAIDALRLKSLPTIDLQQALLIPEPVQDNADEFDYERARPLAANAIGRLPRDRQALLSLAYIDGESRQSLAERFGVPVSTIKTWLRRALERVRADCASFAESQAAGAG